jgi:hypothetical protein
MNGYSFLHFYNQKTNLYNTELKKCTVLLEKEKLMFICQKVDGRFFFKLVGNEVFSKLFHLMCHLLNRIKNQQDTAPEVFRQSPCIIIIFYCINFFSLYCLSIVFFYTKHYFCELTFFVKFYSKNIFFICIHIGFFILLYISYLIFLFPFYFCF